jgi:hypothetical protein
MHTRLSKPAARPTFLLAALLPAAAALTLTACVPRPAGAPVETWPPQERSPSILDRTTAVPGQPEQRAPTSPPSPAPATTPGDAQEQPQPPRTPSPHPPGIPGEPGGPAGPGGPGVPPRTDEGLQLRSPGAEELQKVLDSLVLRSDLNGGPGALRELFPLVRGDIEKRIIEFDGIVPIDAHDPRTPRVYLEVTVCAPDTKEHESLVMTRALASHIHAALLAIGLSPGKPGGFSWENETMTPVHPTGDSVTVSFIFDDADGQRREVPATGWIINAETREPFAASGAGGFVFAGSVMRTRQDREVYDADGVGTIVGLTTFGAETIAWREVISPDSQVHAPEWIANPAAVPKQGTAVTVRLRPARATP